MIDKEIIQPQEKKDKDKSSIPLIFYYFEIEIKRRENDNTPYINILNSYPKECNKEEFKELCKQISQSNDLFNNIFPYRTYFSNNNDEENEKNDQNPLNNDKEIMIKIDNQKKLDNIKDAVIQIANQNENKKEFTHSFEYNYSIINDNNQSSYFNWYFTCSIYFQQKELFEDYDTPKALIIVSKDPFFIYYSELLNQIYSIYIKRSNSLQSNQLIPQLLSRIRLQPFILNYVSRPPGLNIKIENPYTILPFCELNYEKIFTLFSFNDIIYLMDIFIRNIPIVIRSSNKTELYYIYHQLVNCFFPFNKTDGMHSYRIFTEADSAAFYSNEELTFDKEDTSINYDFLKKICKENENSMIVITITITDNSPKAQIENYSLKENDVEIISIKNNNSNYITKFITTYYKEQDIEILYHSITLLFSNRVIKNSSTQKEIRQQLFGFMIRLFIKLFPEVTYVFDNKKLKCNYIRLKTNLGLLNDELTKPLKEFIDCLTTHSLFKSITMEIELDSGRDYNLKEIVYVNEVIKLYKINSNVRYKDDTLFKDKLIFAILINDEQFKAVYKPDCPIMLEFESYYKMLVNKDMPFINKQENVKGIFAFVLSMNLLYDLSNTDVNYNEIKKDFEVLFKLFTSSNGFNQRFDIVLSLIYEIIVSNELLEKEYKDMFIKELVDKSMMTTSIFLRVNNSITNHELKRKKKPKRSVILNQSLIQFNKDHQHNKSEINEQYKYTHCSCSVVILSTIEKELNRVDKVFDILGCFKTLIEKILINQTYFIENVNSYHPEFLKLYRIASFFYENGN